MGRKHRRNNPPSALTTAGLTSPTHTGRAMASEHAFEAAKRTGYKGYFFFPDLSPREQIHWMTREEIMRKCNWAYNNIAEVTPAIDGLALDEVDTGIWPKPASSNSAFNAKLKLLFDQQCGFRKAFSADGEDSFFSGQYKVRREIGLRGQCFGVKLRPGEGGACPQMLFLAAWQCGSGRMAAQDPNGWNDGRLNNKFGRAVAWRFATNRQRSQWMDLAANDVIHFRDPMMIGQDHAMPALTPAVRCLFSIDDIEKAETSGVLLRSRIAYSIVRKGFDGDEDEPRLPGVDEVETRTNADGSTVKVQKVRALDGTEVEVFTAANGELKVVESNKSSESGGWIKALLAKVAYARGYPPAYVYHMADLSQGTGVRFAQDKVQRVLNTVRDFQLIEQYIEEWWPFWVWMNIRAGNLDDVRGGIPDDWWRYQVIVPKNITVDSGREGRLYDERLATGKMPASLYHGMLYGKDHVEAEDEVIRDYFRRQQRIAEIAKEMGMSAPPTEAIFRPPTGGAMVKTESDAAEEDDEPKKKKK